MSFDYEKFKVDVPVGESGDWRVGTFEVSEEDIRFHNLRCAINLNSAGRGMVPGVYTKLCRNGTIVMSDTKAEIRDLLGAYWEVEKRCGHVLINGLGLGSFLKGILSLSNLKSVTVIEVSEDVIKLVAPAYKKDSRVQILHANAFEFKPPKGKRYSVVWHDIWDDICGDNLPDMHKLHRKYGRRADWQGSWCRERCENQW